jgi:hypothetical protein
MAGRPTTPTHPVQWSSSELDGGPSVDDVQREPQRDVECRPCGLIEATDWFVIEIFDRHRDDVVATDDAAFGQPLLGTDIDFGADSPDCPGDRGARDRVQHCDGGITSEDADGSASCGRPKVGPDDVVASYHAGAVRAARRRADWTSAGSGG